MSFFLFITNAILDLLDMIKLDLIIVWCYRSNTLVYLNFKSIKLPLARWARFRVFIYIDINL